MSQRIRIRCKDHEPTRYEGGKAVLVTQRLPDWTDVEVVLVRDDGTEEPITAVNGIEWKIRPGETSTAVLEVVGPALEVDAELGARAPTLRPRAFHAYQRGRADGARRIHAALEALEGGPFAERTEHTAGLELAVEAAESVANEERRALENLEAHEPEEGGARNSAIDALCSDHRNAWARFAAAALSTLTAQPMSEHDRLAVRAVNTGTPEGDAEVELELRRIRAETVEGAARWADMMTDEWKRRFGG